MFYKEKRVMQGKRMIFDEIVHEYIEGKIMKFNIAERSLSKIEIFKKEASNAKKMSKK